MKTKKIHWLIFLVFTGILLLGSYMRGESISETTVIHPIRADAGDYLAYAYNLRFKVTYSRDHSAIPHPDRAVQPDAYRNPGYPLFLALFVDLKPSTKNMLNIIFTQMILSSITLVIAFYVFRGFLSRLWALAAALLTAISPHLIVANSYVLTETLFCFILVLTIAIARLFAEKPSIFKAAGIGICLGAGFLVRPSLQYFPIAVLGFFCIHYGRKKGFNYFVGLLAGFVLVASPWYIRNLVTFNTLSDQRLKVGFLHHGLYPDFTYNGDKNSYGYPYKFDPRSDEIKRNTTTVLNEIANRFQSRPIEHIQWFMLKKPVALWSWEMVQGHREVFVYDVSNTPYEGDGLFRLTYRLSRMLHWPIVGLAFMGLWIAWFAGRPYSGNKPKMLLARFVSALLIYFTILHMAGAPFPRYAVPLRPLLYAMAMFTLSYCGDVIRNRIRSAPENGAANDERPNRRIAETCI
jgi:4-amino-4-deoxy-L-arabinose transferase-like glycosyltransferase